jgi:uncharacterized protein (TIGR02145 family)
MFMNFIIRQGLALLLTAVLVAAAAGTAASAVRTGSFTDKRDGKKYKTVTIGNITWMAENLSYKPQTGNTWCYGDKPDNCRKYGRLYDLETAVKACPSGWHLSTDKEWADLQAAAGGITYREADDEAGNPIYKRAGDPGKKLRTKYGWSGNRNGTDLYGFSAPPGGFRGYNGDFMGAGATGVWWLADPDPGQIFGWKRCISMYYTDDHLLIEEGAQGDLGNSVRCVLDDAPPAPSNTGDGGNEVGAAAEPTDLFTDSRDGQTYKMVKIGRQTWMAKNLNYQIGGSRCYKNSADSCKKYGRLYNWDAAKTACPAGWKLPANQDWDKLAATAGGLKVAGKKLKSEIGWNNDGDGTDDFGFSALPGGYYFFGDEFEEAGNIGFWWSATENVGSYPSAKSIRNAADDMDGNNRLRALGLSVRCLQDARK